MINRALPYYFEDRTGVFTGSDFDDAYDRTFLCISTPPLHLASLVPRSTSASLGNPSPFSLVVYTANRRSSPNKRGSGSGELGTGIRAGEPVAILQFGPRGVLGDITLVTFSRTTEGQERNCSVVHTALQMSQWLKKTSMFGGSLSRKFKASDEEEYRWAHRALDGQEWSLFDSQNRLIAHYNLRPPSKPAFTTSGNFLVVYEPYIHLAVGESNTAVSQRFLTITRRDTRLADHYAAYGGA
ncbi:hypothetical protein EIP86_000014 [Pleurotus ostreatoroseus]|nr:hypothetical protein EIP86_000014 [Pleurotus ostreatoroseus]